jgi:Tfp pilus assembly protein PilO
MSQNGMWNHWRMDLTAASLVAGLAAIAYFAHVAPTLGQYEQAEAQVNQLSSQQVRSRDLERSLLTMKDKLAALERTAGGARQLELDPASELNRRLARLTELASESGLQVDAIERGATADFQRYSTVGIRISGRGSYRSCAAALAKLRTEMPDTGVVSMDLASAAVTSDPAVTFTLDLLWFTQPQGPTTKK